MSDRSSDHLGNISEPEQDGWIGHTFVAKAMENPTQLTPQKAVYTSITY